MLAVQLTALYMSGVLSFVWKYVGMAEVPAFVRAAVGSATVLLGLRLFLPEPLTDLRIPISIIVVNTVLAFGGLLGLRVLRRALWEREVSRRRAAERRRAPPAARSCSWAPGPPGSWPCARSAAAASTTWRCAGSWTTTP